MDKITFEDFKKLDIRIGKILSAERIENSDKLLKLQVDFGPSSLCSSGQANILQIVSGIAEFYLPETLIGKEFPFVVNLEPRILRGVESQGMIMAATAEDKAVLLQPDREIPPGSIVK
jgi:methionine--tRNA ligase beta chain